MPQPGQAAAAAGGGEVGVGTFAVFAALALAHGWLRSSGADLPMIVALTVAILGVQAVWSTLWLRSFRYGPAEWAWRCLTWWRRAPIRR